MLRTIIKGILPCLLFITSLVEVQAQLTVNNSTPNNSSAHLIQNVFMGGQITAMNFRYNGTLNANVTNQVGYFTGGGNIFGIDSGIVMSSGNINSIPNNGFASASFQGAGDADVLSVAQSVGWGTPPTVTRDRAVLEFDFVAPQSDSVSFEYCFGSEEWPVYPCSSYNDAFGFFISGPGINGSYSNNAVNVSVVPGTTSLPVAITSIHAGTGSGVCNGNPSYSQYYNNGPTTNAFTFADLNTNNTYGAWTDVFFTKPVYVNACDTYHVKLAICDGQDFVFDSAVFLKAKSFDFLGISVNPQPSYNPWGFDTALYEGCGNLELFFTRIDTTYPPYTLTYSIAGDATMGVDYETIPGCSLVNGIYECEITFPQDSTSVGFDIDIYYDQIAESVESFMFIVTDSNVSMCASGDTLELNIIDQPVLQLNAFGNTTLDCNDSATLIGVEVVNGLPPYTFTWSNGVTDSIQYVQPTVSSSYSVVVEDGCGFQTETDVVTVGVFNVPWSATKFGDEQVINCTSDPVVMGVNVEFNDQIWHGDISYIWSTGSQDSVISVFSLVDTTYSVTITRNCTGETEVKEFSLFVENDPVVLYTEDTDVDLIDCPGDPIGISVTATGGYPPYSYQWEDGSTINSTIVAPLTTRAFYVTVTDICALEEYVDSVVVHVPVADPLTIRGVQNDTVACPTLKVHFGPAIPGGGFGWGYELSWTDFASNEDYIQDIVYEDTPYTIKLTDGCHADTAEVTVWGIIRKKNDLSVALTNDTTICFGDELMLHAQGVDGGGNYEYYWDGSKTAGDKIRVVQPAEETTYRVRVVDECDTARYGEISVDVSDVEADFEYEYIDDYVLRLRDNSRSEDTIMWHDWTIDPLGLSSSEAEPTFTLPDGNAYDLSLTVTNQFGCQDVATVIIQPEFYLYLPTSFTPNDDGMNETWSIETMGIREMRLEVFDRWGQVIFTTNDKNFEWDGHVNGERVPMGAYTWRVVLITDSDEVVKRSGNLLLLNDFQSR